MIDRSTKLALAAALVLGSVAIDSPSTARGAAGGDSHGNDVRPIQHQQQNVDEFPRRTPQFIGVSDCEIYRERATGIATAFWMFHYDGCLRRQGR